jgi:hypothetical protein
MYNTKDAMCKFVSKTQLLSRYLTAAAHDTRDGNIPRMLSPDAGRPYLVDAGWRSESVARC